MYLEPVQITMISIHAPRMGSDHVLPELIVQPLFQSTLPAWGATHEVNAHHVHPSISIHAPRMGSDHDIIIAR